MIELPYGYTAPCILGRLQKSLRLKCGTEAQGRNEIQNRKMMIQNELTKEMGLQRIENNL